MTHEKHVMAQRMDVINKSVIIINVKNALIAFLSVSLAGK